MSDVLERIREVIKDLDLIEQVFPGSPHSLMHEVAEELIRLRAENQRLREELEALRSVSATNSTTIYMGWEDGAALEDQGGE